MKIEKNKYVTKHTCNQVYALFEADAVVNQFDSGMNATPLTEIVINAGTAMFMTAHYFSLKSNTIGDARYSFIRRRT